MKDERTTERIVARKSSREEIIVTQSMNTWNRRNPTIQMILIDTEKSIRMFGRKTLENVHT